MAKKIHLMIIDPQNSFCKVVPPDQQQVVHDGELCVSGAWDDMVRLGDVVRRLGTKIDRITATLDSHHQYHVAHPVWYREVKTNAMPAPFTQMRIENGRINGYVFNTTTMKFDIHVGEYRTVSTVLSKRTVEYLKTLDASGRYPHMIWPCHCLIGTPGHNIVAPLADALLEWERVALDTVQMVTKGSNMFVEHFSAVQAEVVDPEDPSTQVNPELIQIGESADILVWAGEALSHCVANTFRDMATAFGPAADDLIAKSVLLTDATSSVGGLEFLGDAFLKEMTARGLKLTTCADFLS